MATMAEIEPVRDGFVNMGPAQKRKFYKCQDLYVTLPAISSWQDYYVNNKATITPLVTTGKGKIFEVDDDINRKVSLFKGDLTWLEIEAIVNAANPSLSGEHGVDKCVHKAAGKELRKECKLLGCLPAGSAKWTGAYKLPATYVIHTVGPQGEKPEVLKSCYTNSLKLATQNRWRTLAFPCISAGIDGYPPKQAAHVALQTTREFLDENKAKLNRVVFTTFSLEDFKIYEELMQKYFPVSV